MHARELAGPQGNAESNRATRSCADWKNAAGYHVILTDQAGADSWPITGASFILMYKQPADKSASKQALEFFRWAYANGDQMAKDLDYIPMPQAVVDSVEKMWAKEIAQ